MKNMKNYYIELHATEIKESAKHYAREICLAHFKSAHKPTTPEFISDMKEAIDFYWNQQKRGWLYYAVGKLFVQTGREDVSVMCPSYSEGHRTQPVFEEVK